MNDGSETWKACSVRLLKLNNRSYHLLCRHGINTLGDLMEFLQIKDLREIKNIGDKIEVEIRIKLQSFLAHSSEEKADVVTKANEELEPSLYESPESSSKQKFLYQKWHFYPISNLCISMRLEHLLQRNDFVTLGQLVPLIEDFDLKKIPIKGFGSKLFKELKDALEVYITDLPPSAFLAKDDSSNLHAVPESSIGYTERSEIPLADRIKIWLDSLPNEREREIIDWRYGLKQEPLTLDEVGKKICVTRERVRQIEKRVLNFLTNARHSTLVPEAMSQIKDAFEKFGGIFTTEEFDSFVSFCPPDMRVSGLLNLFAYISDEFGWDSRANVWVWGHIQVAGIQLQIRKILKSMSPMDKRAFIDQLRKANPDLSEQFLMACLRTYPDLDFKDNGALIYKKKARNRTGVIIQALRQIGRPAHFTEITEAVNRLLPEEIEAYPHNIHAHMQRLPEIFVWVGRGTYGLAEAGLERSEFYPDILERVFRECGHPLTAKETLTRVCDVRDCKESTIFMLLTLNPRFRAFPGDVYGLAEWSDDEFYGATYRAQRLLASITDDEFLSRRKPKPTVAQTLRDIDSLLGTSRSEN